MAMITVPSIMAYYIVQRYSNQDHVVLVKRQIHTSMEQNMEPRNIPTQICPTDFWAKYTSNPMQEEWPSQQMVLANGYPQATNNKQKYSNGP